MHTATAGAPTPPVFRQQWFSLCLDARWCPHVCLSRHMMAFTGTLHSSNQVGPTAVCFKEQVVLEGLARQPGVSCHVSVHARHQVKANRVHVRTCVRTCVSVAKTICRIDKWVHKQQCTAAHRLLFPQPCWPHHRATRCTHGAWRVAVATHKLIALPDCW